MPQSTSTSSELLVVLSPVLCLDRRVDSLLRSLEEGPIMDRARKKLPESSLAGLKNQLD
jgi:hypothetical protein